MQKGADYFIVFIDPKGTEHTDYEHKIDGYSRIFEENGNGRKVFNQDGLIVRVFAFLYTDDVNKLSQGYKAYWFDGMDKVLDCILGK